MTVRFDQNKMMVNFILKEKEYAYSISLIIREFIQRGTR